MLASADRTQRFLLENLDIRGQIVRLGPVWQAILARRDYPGPLVQPLGEFALISVLIAAGLKHPGRTVLQVMGKGPVTMAVADCTHQLALRAMLKPGDDAARPGMTLHDWFPEGRLVLTVENAETARHFQSIVTLEGASLAECFEHYFDRSEQVPTHLWVNVTAQSAGALILQKLPEADRRDPDGWARVQREAAVHAPAFLGGRPDGESVADFLTRLFREDDVRLFKPHAVKDGCTRSEEKVVAMLLGLGRVEVEATLAEHGVVTVHDEICNQEYRFTAPDVARIFAGP